MFRSLGDDMLQKTIEPIGRKLPGRRRMGNIGFKDAERDRFFVDSILIFKCAVQRVRMGEVQLVDQQAADLQFRIDAGFQMPEHFENQLVSKHDGSAVLAGRSRHGLERFGFRRQFRQRTEGRTDELAVGSLDMPAGPDRFKQQTRSARFQQRVEKHSVGIG